jgi:hypothetical protein
LAHLDELLQEALTRADEREGAASLAEGARRRAEEVAGEASGG